MALLNPAELYGLREPSRCDDENADDEGTEKTFKLPIK